MRRPCSSCLAVGPGWGVGLGLGLLLAGCSGAHESRSHPPAATVPAQIAPTTNVPGLLGESIDGLRRHLGPALPLPAGLRGEMPGIVLSSAPGTIDSLATFRTGGLLLLASYNTRSRQVRDLLLLGHREDSLMGRASLRPNAAGYLVLPVFYAGRSFRLLGLRVIATN